MAKGCKGHDGEQEDDGEAGEQNRKRDFVWRLLARRAFDQGDHAVEEGFAGVGGDADLDPVGEDSGSAGDGRAVAAGLADDGGGFAGDGGFVDRGNAFDHFAVASDVVACGDVDDVAGAEQSAGNLFQRSGSCVALRDGFALGFAQGVGLCFAAAFGHGFSEVGEQDGKPEPEGDLEIEAKSGAVVNGVVDEQGRGQDAADFDDEHDGVLDHPARIELAKCVDEGLAHDRGIPEAFLFHNAGGRFLFAMLVVLGRQRRGAAEFRRKSRRC